LAGALQQAAAMEPAAAMERPPRLEKVWPALKSLLAGGVATLGDLGTLAVLVGVLSVAPRWANVPALLMGATIQFVGNRHFAFAPTGSWRRQVTLFILAEAVALTLNAVLFDIAARMVPLDTLTALGVRALAGFLVFAGWSYPAWRRIFRAPVDLEHA
jgi:putative flippase GtrA